MWRPKILTPICRDPNLIYQTVNNWEKSMKQKLLYVVDLFSKFLFLGGWPQPGAHRVHPGQKWYLVVKFWNDHEEHSCPSGWVASQTGDILGVAPTLGPKGPPWLKGVQFWIDHKEPMCPLGWVVSQIGDIWGQHPHQAHWVHPD